MKTKKRLFEFNLFYVIVAAVILATTFFGVFQYREKRRYMVALNNTYLNLFQNAAADTEKLKKLFNDASIVNIPEQRAAIFADIWKDTENIKTSLAAIPNGSETVSNAIKYISQTADFSYSMMKKSINNEEISDADAKQIKLISQYSKNLSEELNVLNLQLSMGAEISWDEILDKTPEDGGAYKRNPSFSARSLLGSLSEVAKEFKDYEPIIYEGSYSQQLVAKKPKLTEGKPEISVSKGEEIVKSFLGIEQAVNIQFLEKPAVEAGKIIPTLSYAIYPKDNPSRIIYMDITKYGGYPLWFLSEGNYSGKNLPVSQEDAIAIAVNFLISRGFDNMIPVSNEVYDNKITIDFVPKVSGVVSYPDLIKLKISLTSGDVLGFESKNYVYMHTDRKIPENVVAENEAKAAVTKEFNITELNKCFILLDSGSEAYCYELKGKINDSACKVFINAQSGKVEKIFAD